MFERVADPELEHFYDFSATPFTADWAESDDGVLVDVSSPKFPDTTMLVDRPFADRYCINAKWCVDSSTGYAVAKVSGKKVSFHRLILNAPKGALIDHINRERLDNRRANLRFATAALNSHNRVKKRGTTSQYIGVSWSPDKLGWRAGIGHESKHIHLGYFENEVDAAEAYNLAAITYYGKAAQHNALPTHLQSEVI